MGFITTIHGEMDESLLEKRSGVNWVEYWLNGELVKRSAGVDLDSIGLTPGTGKMPLGINRAERFVTHDPPVGTTFDKFGVKWTFGKD